MDKTIQTCDVCQAPNLTRDKTWLRSFGIYTGSPVPVLQRPPPNAALQPAHAGMLVAPKDICSACAAKLTVPALILLHTPPAPVVSAAPVTPVTPAK